MTDEPTVGEQLRRLGDALARIEGAVNGLVSHERFEHSNELLNRDIKSVAGEVEAIQKREEKRENERITTRRMVWTALAFPLCLLLLQVYVLPTGK